MITKTHLEIIPLHYLILKKTPLHLGQKVDRHLRQHPKEKRLRSSKGTVKACTNTDDHSESCPDNKRNENTKSFPNS